MEEALIEKSVYILREVKAQFQNPAVLWSTGKDSTTMLHLIKQAFFGTVPFPVIHLDTGKKFPEIYEYRDNMAKEWNLDLVVSKPYLDASPERDGHFNCCMHLKTENLKNLLRKEGYDALIMSIRRDEHYMRNMERFFSPRDKEFKWHLVRPKTEGELGDAPFTSEQDTELSGWNLYASDFQNCNHVRVHPILHWSEDDCWKFLLEHKIPVNPLYFKGYRSLGCMPCTSQVWNPPPKSVEEIIQFVQADQHGERKGRAQDKESEQVMRRLRSLGYM